MNKSSGLPTNSTELSCAPNRVDKPALDDATLATLREVLEEDMVSVLEVFMEEAPLLIAEATAAVTAGDLVKLKACAHSLKSSSANIGALGLADCAHKLETGATRGDPTKVTATLAKLQSEYARVDSELKSLI